MSRNLSIVLASLALLAMLPAAASAGLFHDQMNNGAGWGVNGTAGGDWAATFGYDYSADGIPEAPHSHAGDDATTGLKTEANIADGAVAFFTAYPTGQSFSNNYRLRFDAWMNYGTGGTTEFLGGGVGYNDLDADLTSGAEAIATGDGGSASDWRALKNGFFVPPADMAGGTRQGSEAYYADFLPSVGGSAAGSPGFQWITWEFDVNRGVVDVTIEKPDGSRLPIATMDCNDTSDGSSGCSANGNISLYYADFFTSLGDPTESTFGLIDNVSVVPEPAAAVLLGLAALGLGFVRRR